MVYPKIKFLFIFMVLITLASNSLALNVKHSFPPVQLSSKKSTNKKAKSHWDGTNAQLGLIVSGGNTNAVNFTAGLDVIFKSIYWGNFFQLNAFINKSEGVVTKDQYFANEQLNYYIDGNHSNYFFLSGRLIYDRFSAYYYQSIVAAGYGRELFKTKCFSLGVQGGPGLRYSRIRFNSAVESNWIFTSAADARWKIRDNITLAEKLAYDFGQPFDYLRSVTSLTATLVSHLAVQASYTVEYYSNIPPHSSNTKKTDTIFNVSLVYNW